MTAAHHIAGNQPSLDSLPFTAIGLKGWRRFWDVRPTGDYAADCATGGRFGLEYLAYLEANRIGEGCLGSIVREMPRDLSGIEIGFLHAVSNAARAGAWQARQIEAWYDSQRAELAKKPARSRSRR